jgi:hypothetical protein
MSTNSENMDISEYKSLAKKRLLSGQMTDVEWGIVLDALLHESEGDGLDEFDDAIVAEWDREKAKCAK